MPGEMRRAMSKNMRTTAIISFCLCLCLLSACSGHRSAYEQLKDVDLPAIVTFADPAQTIRVKSRDRFIIVLDSNATTGYAWQAPERTSYVSLNAHRYEAAQSLVTGAGGREYFEFTARSAGKERLVFQYARPWEKRVPPAHTATFTVEVADAPKKK